GVLIGFAPAIASSMAPGIIETAAGGSIKGSVKVKDLALSWGGPTKVGPVELYDDTGALVGRLETTVPAGLWRVVSEQWWSQKQLDVGIVELGGKLDVVRDADGSSNLDRALAPKTPSAAPSPKGSVQPGGGGAPFD